MINELAGSPTRLENVYFINNEQASTAVSTAVLCFTHAEHHLIKFKLYNNWSVQTVNSVPCEIQKKNNQICSSLKISQSIKAESSCDRNNRVVWCRERKKTEDSENVFF